MAKAKKAKANTKTTIPTELAQAATGTPDAGSQKLLLNQVLNTFAIDELDDQQRESLTSSVLGLLMSIGPQDGPEGMLAAQMVAGHCTAMKCLGRANTPGISAPFRDQELKHGTKLMNLFTRQLDTLQKSRIKVTVGFAGLTQDRPTVAARIPVDDYAAYLARTEDNKRVH